MQLVLFYIISVFGIISFCAQPVLGQTITISDSDFILTDWNKSVINSVNGASDSATRETSGGNPGAYRRMVHYLPPNGAISVFHYYVGASYNPSIQGAIQSVDYSEDRKNIVPPFSGAAIGARVALIQGGIIYRCLTDVSFDNTNWDNSTINNLTASSFLDKPTNSQNPDFSSSGAEIHFGYIRSNTNISSSSSYNTDHGIDNWSVTVHHDLPVPVPTLSATGLVFMSALILIFAVIIFRSKQNEIKI